MTRSLLLITLLLITLSPTANADLVDLVTGLTNYWDFDGASGTALDDRVGSNNGTLQGFSTPTWTSGRFGNALTFDGINDQVALGTFNVAGNQMSLGGWVRLNRLPTSLPTPYEGIFDSASDAFVLYADKDNQELRFKVTDQQNDAARPGVPQNQLATGNWTHVLGVYDGTQNRASIYLNGVLVDQHIGSDFTPGPLTGNVLSGQNAFFGSEGGMWYFSGAIDDFAVWNRAITFAEINQLQSASLGVLTAIPEASSVLSISAVGILIAMFVVFKPQLRKWQLSR